MLGVWDSLVILRPPPKVISLAPPFAAHTDCLEFRLSILKLFLALGGHPLLLASLKFWGSLLSWSCTFTNSLPWAFFMVPTVFMTPSIPGLQLLPRLHRWPLNCMEAFSQLRLPPPRWLQLVSSWHKTRKCRIFILILQMRKSRSLQVKHPVQGHRYRTMSKVLPSVWYGIHSPMALPPWDCEDLCFLVGTVCEGIVLFSFFPSLHDNSSHSVRPIPTTSTPW